MKPAAHPFALIGLMLAGPVLAQEEPTEVESLIVTAAPYAVSLDSATTHVEVIGRAQLETGAPAGLGDVLAEVPGLRSSAFAPGASRPVIRGQSGPRILVLQNGVGLIDASTLSPDHAVASDPAAASRIEILRGPSVLAYGGSAIGGVVNIIDERIPTRRPEDGLEGRASGSAGGPGDARAASGALTVGRGPFVLTLDADHREGEAYDIPVPAISDRLAVRDGLTVDPVRKVLNTEVESDGFGAGVSYVDAAGYLGVAYRRTESLYGVPFPQVLAPLDPEAEGPVRIDLAQDRIDLRGEREARIGPLERVRLSAGWSDYEHAELEAATGEVGTLFRTDGAEARIELIQKARGGRQGAVGVQGLSREMEAIGDEAFIPPARVQEAGLFTLQRLDRATWGLDAGLRVDRRRLEAQLAERPASEPALEAGIDWASARADQSFDNVSASAGVFWRPTDRAFYALSLSRNARAPTEFELFADGPHPGTGAFELGDPTLDSEVVVSLDASARWRTERTHLQLYLFGADYDGFIDQRPTGGMEDGLPVFRFLQTNARFHGGEVEVSHDLWRDGARSLSLEAAFDWMRGETDLGPPARIPPYAATVRLIWSGARLDAELEARTVGEQHRVADLELPTGGHTLVNASAGWRPFSDRRLTLFVEGLNLTDEEAREHVSFLKDIAPLPGRSIRLGAAARF